MESLNINNLFAYLFLSTIAIVGILLYLNSNQIGIGMAWNVSHRQSRHVSNGIQPALACHLGHDYIERHGLSPPRMIGEVNIC